jgi:hypothetical protein
VQGEDLNSGAPGLYICGAPSIWFDYEIGERSHTQGFVCDEHKVSERVEKLAQPKIEVAPSMA